VSTETRSTRSKPNIFDPVLSSNAYVGRIKENERLVRLEPRLYASDADPTSSINGQLMSKFFSNDICCLGKVCGYDLSWYKHDDLLDEITRPMPFAVEMIDNQAALKLNAKSTPLDCETTATYRLFIRAFDCAPGSARRYSER
jgi:hypothetical protein